MKKARKLTAVLLSLVMLLALVVPASAAENYSITIHNDKTGHTYEAYQIFAGTVSSDEETNGETGGPMLGDITWGSGVDGTTLLAALKEADVAKYGACETAAEVAKALGAENATAEHAAAFAEISALHLTNVAGTANEPVEGNYVINNLAAGYYLVKDKDGSLQDEAATATDYIVQVLGNVAMAPKSSDIPTLEKKVYDEEFARDVQNHPEQPYGTGYNDVADWDIGDNVPFKLIASVPDADEIAAYDTYTYTFHDTLDASLELLQKNDEHQTTFEIYFVDDLTTDPRVGGFQYLDEEKYDVTVDDDTNSFTITLDDLKTLKVTTADNQENPATDYNYVVIFYDAVLNTQAEIGQPGNVNTAYLEFSNDPNGDGTGRTEDDKVIVFTYELDGEKVDGEAVNTKLAGAEFVLLNPVHTQAAAVDDNGTVTSWVTVQTHGDNEDAVELPTTYEEWLQRYPDSIVTSDENGKFKISGIDDGTYHLLEIKAPNGYNLLEDPVELVISATTDNGQTWNGNAADAFTALTITVNDGDAQQDNTGTGIVNVTVKNNQGATLPETGGMGTTLFYIIGGLLVVGAGILLVVRIRMKAHNE